MIFEIGKQYVCGKSTDRKCVCQPGLMTLAFCCVALCLSPVASHADFLGLTPVYSASVKEHKDRSVDVGIALFDDYQLTAVRVNQKFQKKWIGSVEFGLVGQGDAGGITAGVGAMYSLTDNKSFRDKFRGVFKKNGKNWHLGVRTAANIASYEQNEETLGASAARLSVFGSTKNRPRDEKLLKWFADVGLQFLTRETFSSGKINSESELNLAMTGGFIYPFLIVRETVYGNQYGGEIFSALSISDGTRLLVGFRYNFK